MLAKVIAAAPTRDDALDLLREALAGSRVDGVVTNLGLLRELPTTRRCARPPTRPRPWTSPTIQSRASMWSRPGR